MSRVFKITAENVNQSYSICDGKPQAFLFHEPRFQQLRARLFPPKVSLLRQRGAEKQTVPTSMGFRFKPASSVTRDVKPPATKELQPLTYGTFKKHTVRFQMSKEKIF